MRFLNLLGNKFFSVIFTWILNQRFKDTLCGTKVLFRKDYEKIQATRSYFGGKKRFYTFITHGRMKATPDDNAHG